MINIPHLETDVTQACQLSCVACNHSVPLWRKHGPWSAKPRQVEADLHHLAQFMRAEKWGALGGEPLLNKQLPEILAIARASQIAPILEVWTNGIELIRSPHQPQAFWDNFDHLVVSIYPGKLTDTDVASIERLCQEHGKLFSPRDERTNPNFKTMLEPTPTNRAQTRDKFAGCFFRHFSRSASYGFFFTCCCGPHIPMLIQGQPFGTDGVRIDGCTEADITAYLGRSEPLGACYSCAGRDTAVAIPWREERDPEAWQRASAGRS